MKIPAQVDWNKIDTVLLDMDGTLLDRHFDDYFWEHYVPEVYARQNNMDIEAAKKKLLAMFKSREGTLDWTDLDYWSRELGLDIPALKIKINHLIAVHPYVKEFLHWIKEQGKGIFLVTNAHSKTLAIKMEKTALAGYFDRTICAEEVGMAKEDPAFWPRLAEVLDIDLARSFLGEDSERILESAAEHDFGGLIFVAKPSSMGPVHYSARFPSIVFFNELI